MLPDFPQIKEQIKIDLQNKVRNTSNSDPLVNKIPKIIVHEGHKGIYHTVDGERKEIEYKRFESRFNVKTEKVKERGLEVVKEIGESVGEDLKKQLCEDAISSIDEIVKQTGNEVSANGKPLSPKLILDALEKIEISFNDDGTPNMPSLFIPHSQLEKINEKLPEWEKDEDSIKRQKEIMEAKKNEWDVRESNRKLVD